MQLGQSAMVGGRQVEQVPTTKNLGDISCEAALALCCEPCEVSRDLTVGLLLVWGQIDRGDRSNYVVHAPKNPLMSIARARLHTISMVQASR